MAFCGKCGTQLGQNERFCPNCGAQTSVGNIPNPVMSAEQRINAPGPDSYGNTSYPGVPTAPATVKRYNLKRILIIAAVCIAVLAIASVIAVSAVSNTPKALIGTSISRTMEDISESSIDFTDNGSLSLAFDLSNWDCNKLGLPQIPLSADVKLFFDGDDAEFALQAEASLDNETVDLSAFISEDDFALRSDRLLSNAYGIDLKNAEKNLEDSVFAPGSGKYAMDKISYDSLMQSMKNQKNFEELSEKLNQVLERYTELAIEAACEKGNAEKSDETISVGSDRVDTTAVTLTFDRDAMQAFLTVLYDEFIEDEELRELLEEYVELSAVQVSGQSAQDIVDELYEELSRDDFYDMLDGIKADLELKAVFYVAESNKHLAALKISEGNNGSLMLTLGEALAKTEEISFSYEDRYERVDVIYSISENTADTYRAKFTVSEDGDVAVSCKIDWDKSSGEFEISGSADYDDFGIKGSLIWKEDEIRLSVREISDDYMTADVDVSLTFAQNTPMPKLPLYRDILTMTEEEIDETVEEIVNNIRRLGLIA